MFAAVPGLHEMLAEECDETTFSDEDGRRRVLEKMNNHLRGECTVAGALRAIALAEQALQKASARVRTSAESLKERCERKRRCEKELEVRFKRERKAFRTTWRKELKEHVQMNNQVNAGRRKAKVKLTAAQGREFISIEQANGSHDLQDRVAVGIAESKWLKVIANIRACAHIDIEAARRLDRKAAVQQKRSNVMRDARLLAGDSRENVFMFSEPVAAPIADTDVWTHAAAGKGQSSQPRARACVHRS